MIDSNDDTAHNTEPAARRRMNIVAAFLGPILSVRIPLGICISVYAHR